MMVIEPGGSPSRLITSKPTTFLSHIMCRSVPHGNLVLIQPRCSTPGPGRTSSTILLPKFSVRSLWWSPADLSEVFVVRIRCFLRNTKISNQNYFLFFSEFFLAVKQNKTKRANIFVLSVPSCTSVDSMTYTFPHLLDRARGRNVKLNVTIFLFFLFRLLHQRGQIERNCC